MRVSPADTTGASIAETGTPDVTCLSRDQFAALAALGHRGDVQAVQRMICRKIAAALHAGELARARALHAALSGDMVALPEALRGNRLRGGGLAPK